MTEITKAFRTETGRMPTEGDMYCEQPQTVTDGHGRAVTVQSCWSYENGRWEGFVSIIDGGRIRAGR